jgi:tetratricopeptide (TPR) repeat protein
MKKGYAPIILILCVLIISAAGCSTDGGRQDNIQGDQSYRMNDFRKAIEFYNKAISADKTGACGTPAAGTAYIHRGLCYLRMGLYNPAIADFTAVIQLDGSNYSAYDSRALAYQQLGMVSNAAADYRQSLTINPTNVNCFNNVGILYDRLGLFDLAISNYDFAIKLRTNYSQAYVNKGLAYYNRSNYTAAILVYNAGQKMDPKNIQIYLSRGNAYMASGRYKQAADDYQSGLNLIRIKPEYISYSSVFQEALQAARSRMK